MPNFTSPPTENVPGTVVAHSPAASGIYLGSPGLAVLPDGAYLAKMDEFGPATADRTKDVTHVCRSRDRGGSWERIATIEGLFWASLTVHDGAALLIGTEREYSPLVAMRSTDSGATWTTPRDASTGRLLDDGRYHTAPMPVVEHKSRLWRAVEEVRGRWGIGFAAFVMSAPADADLLDARSWTRTNAVPPRRDWLNGRFGGWLEGNAVVAPGGGIVNILRADYRDVPEKAAVVRVDTASQTASFDPDAGFVDFPGGCKKFTIRYDPVSRAYWSIASAALRLLDGVDVERIRNTAVLLRSENLRDWTVRAGLLHNPDPLRHGYQYVDWRFDGEDIIALVRTAHDDGLGGAHNQHDSNFITFHRIPRFRDMSSPVEASP